MPDTTAKLSQHKGQKPRHQLHSVRGQLHTVVQNLQIKKEPYLMSGVNFLRNEQNVFEELSFCTKIP
ncbi:hypothetical protein [Campylobacter concisus]|uniref:hypothetical protein n=1 Tax=Campylobacter concisus TaxID=199 RepID=UPI001F3F98F3|nr:hypothetical protein [Campylobacter concisus]